MTQKLTPAGAAVKDEMNAQARVEPFTSYDENAIAAAAIDASREDGSTSEREHCERVARRTVASLGSDITEYGDVHRVAECIERERAAVRAECEAKLTERLDESRPERQRLQAELKEACRVSRANAERAVKAEAQLQTLTERVRELEAEVLSHHRGGFHK